MASWYGDATAPPPSGLNCWLKELEVACQFPADLEVHTDNRFLLLVRPVEECELLFSLLSLWKVCSFCHVPCGLMQ
jgi:hypothetical protein